MNGNLPYIVTLPLQMASSMQPGGVPPQTLGPPGVPPTGPPGLPPGPTRPPSPPDPTGLPIPMPLRPVPVRPVYQQRFQMPPPNYNVPPIQSLVPQGIQTDMLRKASNQDNSHAETSQPSNVTPHAQSQPLMQTSLLLPERHYYPRIILPSEDHYKKYTPIFQPSYQVALPAMIDNAHYNSIDVLPAESRNDCRVNPNYALVNGDRNIEQTWASVNEAFFDGPTKVRQPFLNDTEDRELEEELEALVRRIDTELKNTD